MQVIIQHSYLVEVEDLDEAVELARAMGDGTNQMMELEATINDIDLENMPVRYVGWSALDLD